MTKHVKVCDLFVYCFISMFSLSYAFYHSSIHIPDSIQTFFTVGCCVVFLMYLIRRKYKYKELILYMLLFGIGVSSYLITRMSIFLLIILASIMIGKGDISKVMVIVLIVNILNVLITGVCSIIGFIPMNIMEVYKSGAVVQKNSFGFNHPNQLGQALGIINLLQSYFCVAQEKKFSKVLNVFTIIISYFISGSRSALIICVLYFIFVLFYEKERISFRLERKLYKNSWFFMILIIFLAVGCPYLMDKVYGWNKTVLWKVNGLLGSRFSYASAVMSYYPVSLFGNLFNFSYLNTLYGHSVLDNGYINLLYNFGLTAFIIYIVCSIKTVRFFSAKHEGKVAFLLLLLNLWGAIENIVFLPTINISVFFLGSWIQHYRKEIM